MQALVKKWGLTYLLDLSSWIQGALHVEKRKGIPQSPVVIETVIHHAAVITYSLD